MRLITILCLLASNLACRTVTDGNDLKIIGGSSHQNLQSYIGLPGPCSGTKISDDAILTAGHCVSTWNGASSEVRYLFSAGSDLVVSRFLADDPTSGQPVRLRIASVALHPSWIDGLQRHHDSIQASFDARVSDAAIIRVEPGHSEFLAAPSAPIDFVGEPLIGAEHMIGGLARLGSRSVHTAWKTVESVRESAYSLSKIDADGSSQSNVHTGDSGGGVYDRNGKIRGIAVGGFPHQPSEDERALVERLIGLPPQEADATIRAHTGYSMNFEEFMRVVYNGAINIVRVDRIGAWLRQTVE